jgi:hypothetical protein
MKASTAVFFLGAVLMGSSALAQGYGESGPPPGGQNEFMQACGADVQALCPAAQTPKDRHMCIRDNLNKISGTCSSFVAERRMERTQGMQAQPGYGAPQGPGQPSGPPGQAGYPGAGPAPPQGPDAGPPPG